LIVGFISAYKFYNNVYSSDPLTFESHLGEVMLNAQHNVM
jgi:hypothetical protein